MKRIATVAIVVVAILAIAAAAAPFLIPGGFLKARVAAEVASLTGRPVSIGGDAALAVYPEVTVSVGGLTVGNRQGAGDDPFVTADQLITRVRLLPLLLGRVEFDRFELVKPHVHLVVGKDGPNWSLADSAIVAPTAAGAAPADVRVGRLIVSDGVIDYDDVATSRREELSAIDLDVAWPVADAAVSGSGTLQWRGEPVEFTAFLATPLDLIRGGVSQARFAIGSTPLRAVFAGRLTAVAALQFDGQATVSTPSLRRAIEWLGTPMGQGSILGAGSIEGVANWTRSTISFDQADVELDGNTAQGALAATFGGVRPAVEGTLSTDKLDLSPYLEAIRADVTAAGPWPMAPARLPLAAALDADVRLSADEVIMAGATTGRTVATVALEDGALDVGVGEADFLGGKVTANLDLAAADDGLAAKASATFDTVPAGPVLADLAGISALNGSASATFDLTSRGKTWGEVANNLAGTGKIAVADGSLAGFDMAALATAMGDPLAEPVSVGAGTTFFAGLTATLAIATGKISSDDLTMRGSDYALSLKGSGSVLSGSVQAAGTLIKGGESDALAITGTWSEPTVAPANAPTLPGALPAPAATPG